MLPWQFYYLCKHTYGYGLPQRSISGPVKNLPAMQETQETWVQSLGCEDPPPVFLPRESHGQRNLVGYSPWGRRVGHDGSYSAHTQTHTPVYIKVNY